MIHIYYIFDVEKRNSVDNLMTDILWFTFHLQIIWIDWWKSLLLMESWAWLTFWN